MHFHVGVLLDFCRVYSMARWQAMAHAFENFKRWVILPLFRMKVLRLVGFVAEYTGFAWLTCMNVCGHLPHLSGSCPRLTHAVHVYVRVNMLQKRVKGEWEQHRFLDPERAITEVCLAENPESTKSGNCFLTINFSARTSVLHDEIVAVSLTCARLQ